MGVMESIESSAVIAGFKEQWAEANAKGDTAGMQAAHAAANAYREAVGGYTHVYTAGGGTSFAVNVSDSSKYNAQVNETLTNKNQVITIVDSEKPKSDAAAMQPMNNTAQSLGASISGLFGGSSSGGTLDTYLGYAFMGLVIVAVLKKVF